VPTKGTFKCSTDEAAHLQSYFAPLSKEDLQHLGRFDMALKVNGAAGMADTVTVHTAPPPSPTPFFNRIKENTRKNFARPVAEVEAEIAARHQRPDPRKRPKIGEMDE
jgi:hypothetical protein